MLRASFITPASLSTLLALDTDFEMAIPDASAAVVAIAIEAITPEVMPKSLSFVHQLAR